MYARFARGLASFLREQTTLDDARQTIRERLTTREDNFLRILNRGIYGYPASPYLALLKEAGCQQGDVVRLVRSVGLDEALRQLLKAGVYVEFDEFKGRKPIQRGRLTLPVTAGDFDNPYLKYCYETATSGSSGPRSRTWLDLDHLAATTCHTMVGLDVHGLDKAPTVIWRPILPACTGVTNVLRSARVGNVARKWFSPLNSEDLRPSLTYAASTWYILLAGRLMGVPLPRPEPVRTEDAVRVARWAATVVQESGACLIRTYVSLAVRVALAAVENGINLEGVVLMGGGEPPTPSKVRHIQMSGARWVPTYAFSEFGQVGVGCANPKSENDLHLFEDGIFLVPVERELPGWEAKVNVFHFTTLLPTSPKILLNVGLDDYGTVERRSCGCGLESLGLRTHVEGIRSFSKLTGEGMSVAGSEMQEILESVLPQRFGGTPFDYQLEEREDSQGFTRLELLVSPEIQLPENGGAVLAAILSGMRSGSPAAELARAIWKEANSLRIRREKPVASPEGKYFCIRKVRCPKG